MRFWAEYLRGRIWSPAALAMVVGGLLGQDGAWSSLAGCATALLWTAATAVYGRRGTTLCGPVCAWCAIVCWAAIRSAPTPSAELPLVDLALTGASARVQVVAADGGCQLRGDRVAWTADWLASCGLGADRVCRKREGRLWVSSSHQQLPDHGRQLHLLGRIRPPHGYANPGRNVGAGRASSGRIVGSIRLRSADDIVAGAAIASRAPSLNMLSMCALRGRLSSRLQRATSLSKGLVAALTTGDRSRLDRRLVSLMRRSGTAHLLAVSGTHVCLVVAAVLAALRFVARRLPVTLLRVMPLHILVGLGGALAGWAYVFVAGAPASAVRAMVMATMGLVHWSLGREGDLLESLGFALIVLLLAQPAAIVDVGLRLSVLGVIGVGLGAHWRGGQQVSWWRRLVVVSLAAWATTSLVSVPVFGRVTWAAPVANAVITPFFAVAVLPLSLLLLLWAGAGEWAGAKVDVGAGVIELAVTPLKLALQGLEHLPLHWLPVSVPGCVMAPLCGCAIFLAVVVWLHGRRYRWLPVVLLMVTLSCGPLHRRMSTPPPGVFSAWLLDVGHGDATFVRLSDGSNMLIDGGGAPGDDGAVGMSAVLPFLNAMGARRIDRMILSHPDADHENGLLAVARELSVGEFWHNGDASASAEHRNLLAELHKQGTLLRRVGHLSGTAAVELTVQGVAVEVLSITNAAMSRNNRSLVVDIRGPSAALLLTGDVEAPAEALLARRPLVWRPLRVLKVPHHGSASSSSLELLRWAQPGMAVVSARPWARHRLPAASVVARYRRRGTRLWSTSSGAISLWAAGDSIELAQGSRHARLLFASPP